MSIKKRLIKRILPMLRTAESFLADHHDDCSDIAFAHMKIMLVIHAIETVLRKPSKEHT